MATQINVTKSAWVEVYATAGITEGNAMEIQNLTAFNVYIQESATEPVVNFGNIITGLSTNTSVVEVASGSAKIWLRALGEDCVLAVSEV